MLRYVATDSYDVTIVCQFMSKRDSAKLATWCGNVFYSQRICMPFSGNWCLATAKLVSCHFLHQPLLDHERMRPKCDFPCPWSLGMVELCYKILQITHSAFEDYARKFCQLCIPFLLFLLLVSWIFKLK